MSLTPSDRVQELDAVSSSHGRAAMILLLLRLLRLVVPSLGTSFSRILLQRDLVRSLLGPLLLIFAIFLLLVGFHLVKVVAQATSLVDRPMGRLPVSVD